MTSEPTPLSEILAKPPGNWGRWGPDGAVLPLHAALSRNLGVMFVETHWLEDWADDCAQDGKYDGLYIAAPLKIRGGSGSPVNPVIIKWQRAATH